MDIIDKDLCPDGMAQIFEKIQQNIFVYSVDGICLYTNDHLADILGKPVGKHLSEIFPHRSENHIKKILADYKKIWETQKGDIIPVQKEILSDGKEHIFSVTRSPITWHGVPCIAGIGKDISDLFLAKEDAEYAKQKLGEFIRHIIHDMKNPAGAVLGFTDLVDEKIKNCLNVFSCPESEKIFSFLDIIKQSGDKIIRFLSDLEDYGKYKDGASNLKLEYVDAQNFFSNIIDQQKGYLNNINKKLEEKKKPIKNIEILLDESIEKLPFVISVDKYLLERVFGNLIGNAIKFTDFGKISVFVEKSNKLIGSYIFKISDTGIGIDSKYHQTIFEEFKQADSSYKAIENGTGLGLSIVSKMVVALGGKMLPIESQLGQGSIFSFELPLE